jgi:hypothetical protein
LIFTLRNLGKLNDFSIESIEVKVLKKYQV